MSSPLLRRVAARAVKDARAFGTCTRIQPNAAATSTWARAAARQPRLTVDRRYSPNTPARHHVQRRLFHSYQSGPGGSYHYTHPDVQRLIIFGFVGACITVHLGWLIYKVDVQKSRRSLRPARGSEWAGSRIPKDAAATARTAPWNMEANWVLSAPNLDAGRWWTLLSHCISHEHPYHLFGNSVTWVAFSRTAFRLGLSPARILTLCLASTVAGAYAHLWDARRKNKSDQGAIGASGMISGLAAYVTCIAPKLRFQLLFIPVGIPLYVLTPALFVVDFYYGKDPDAKIGHWAHIGGTLSGVVMFLPKLLTRGW